MKKVFVILALMIFSAQVFAQHREVDGKGRPATIDKQNCPDYLDCATGEIKYFEYKQDFTIDAPEVCGPLGVTAYVIQKGRYEVTRTSSNGGGKVVLTLKNRGKVTVTGNNKSFTIFGSSVKNDNCGDAGNSCFHSIATGNEKKIPIIITPIFENDRCVAIELQYKGVDPKSYGF